MGGLGIDVSPIKMRSAPAENIWTTEGTQINKAVTSLDQRALRGLKALARAK
jgi:hypothetical protein